MRKTRRIRSAQRVTTIPPHKNVLPRRNSIGFARKPHVRKLFESLPSPHICVWSGKSQLRSLLSKGAAWILFRTLGSSRLHLVQIK